MGMFFNVHLDTLDDLLFFELKDLYDAEQRLCEAIPTMADAATSPALAQAFRTHLEQTRRHVSRLEQAFVDLGRSVARETCDAMKGLIKEGSEIVDAVGDFDVQGCCLDCGRTTRGTLRNRQLRFGTDLCAASRA